MKALPCKMVPETGGTACKGDLKQKGLRILGRAVAAMPGGVEPYLVGRPASFPLRVKCGACKRISTFSAAEFAVLPELTVEQLEAFGMLQVITRDWVGDGHTHEQAKDLLRAGFGLDELRALPKQERE